MSTLASRQPFNFAPIYTYGGRWKSRKAILECVSESTSAKVRLLTSLAVCDAGDKRSNALGRSPAMGAASASFHASSMIETRRYWSQEGKSNAESASSTANDQHRYLMELQQRIALIEQSEKGQRSPFSSNFDTQTNGLFSHVAF